MKPNDYSSTHSAPDHLSNGDGAVSKAALGAHSAVDKVVSAADNAARRAIPAIDRAAEYAHRAVDKAAIGVRPAAEWINDQATSLGATQKKLVSSTRDYVAANPLKSLGVALAAGFLVSRLIRK